MRKKYFDYIGSSKKIIVKFSKAVTRLYYQDENGVYICDGHAIYKTSEEVFGPYKDDFKQWPGMKALIEARPMYNGGSYAKYTIAGCIDINIDGKKPRPAAVLVCDDQFKIVNPDFLKPFEGADNIVFYEVDGTHKKYNKTPLLIQDEEGAFCGYVLPVMYDKPLEEVMQEIQAHNERIEKEAQIQKGVIISRGRDSFFIPDGKKDKKTLQKVTEIFLDIAKITDPATREKWLHDENNAAAIKKIMYNVTVESNITDSDGVKYISYRSTDRKSIVIDHCKENEVINRDGVIFLHRTAAEIAAATAANNESADNTTEPEKAPEKAENDATTAENESTINPANNEKEENMKNPENIRPETVKTEKAPVVIAIFKDGSRREYPAAAANILKNDPCVDSVIDPAAEAAEAPATDEPKKEPTTAAPTASKKAEKAPTASKKAPDDQKPVNIDDITPDNFLEFVPAFFFGSNNNRASIMLAGIEAGVFGYDDFIKYITPETYGALPNYHTFDVWKNNGYIVKKGEKNAFSADIWKYTEKHGKMTAEEAASLNAVMIDESHGPYKEGDETTTSKYIRKTAFFFGPEQVEKIEKKPFTAPAGCTLEIINGREVIKGDTKPHKDIIKAAGFFWNKKEAFWYRTA